MKKFTFLLSIALVGSVGFAQSVKTTASIEGDTNALSEMFGTQSATLAPCAQTVVSNNGENGLGYLNDLIIANDVQVGAGENFSVTQFSVNVMIEPGFQVEEVSVFFYENNNGSPGSEITSQEDMEPTSQEVVGTAFGYDIRNLVVDLETPVVLNGDAGSPTTYWVGVLTAYNGAGMFGEVTSTITNNESYFYDTDLDRWVATSEPDPIGFGTAYDLVGSVSGDCNPLSVESNMLSQVSIYPNPTSGLLNLKTPSHIEVNSVALYDLLGKKVIANYNNGHIDMTSLTSGVYLLKVETSAGTLTQKVVKE